MLNDYLPMARLRIKPILKVLQEAGGQLERSEIKARIADMNDQIAEFAEIEKKSKKPETHIGATCNRSLFPGLLYELPPDLRCHCIYHSFGRACI